MTFSSPKQRQQPPDLRSNLSDCYNIGVDAHKLPTSQCKSLPPKNANLHKCESNSSMHALTETKHPEEKKKKNIRGKNMKQK